MTWAAFVGVPIIVVWVIGMPLIALIILIKNRKKLDEEYMKKYLLIIYQGLKPEKFYWEFVNTFRKILVLLIVVFMSSYPAIYQILVSISKFLLHNHSLVVIVMLLRLQYKLNPYKSDDNNNIELMSLKAALITIASGLIFVQENQVGWFQLMIVIVLFFANGYFLVNWIYLFVGSLNLKNKRVKEFLKIVSVLICKKESEVKLVTPKPKLKQELSLKLKKKIKKFVHKDPSSIMKKTTKRTLLKEKKRWDHHRKFDE